MSNAVKTLTRIGKISYLNSLPFYHGLLSGDEKDITFYESYPSKINMAMRHGKIDLAPVSSLEYLNNQDKYLLLPNMAIASRDFSGSVLLMAREKLDGLDNEKIALSRQSLSSAALLRILLRFKYQFKNHFVSMNSDPEKMLKKYKAALVIGDDALLHKSEDFIYKYDLSELWWDWTEMPFCFAVWVVRREFAEHNPETVRLLYRALAQNRDRNLSDLQRFLKEALNLSFLDERFAKLYGYFFNLYYALDTAIAEGLELFYRLAHRLGVSPRPKKLEYFK
ncbi:MAG: menaquinone biosynthesis protein [Candidatus Omnitrophota bacterium]|nr:menaquinone biosynthesis protein [Candidatus Omnitrophota bacterium]